MQRTERREVVSPLRDSLASASVVRLTAERKPTTRNCSAHESGHAPAFTRTPRGCQPRDATQFLEVDVQIGVKQNRPTAPANA